MKLPFHMLLLSASNILLYTTEALPKRNWFSSSQNSPADDMPKDCTRGICVQIWNCPENSVISENSKLCATEENSDWVCCVYPSDNDVSYSATNSHATEESYRLPSLGLEGLPQARKFSRDIVIDDEPRESYDINVSNDRLHHSDIRKVKTSENDDYAPNYLKTVTNPSEHLKKAEGYWNSKQDTSRTNRPFATYSTDTWVWPESEEDYWDKPVEKPTPQRPKSTHFLNFDDKKKSNLFPVTQSSFSDKLWSKQSATTTRLNKTTHTPLRNTSTKLWRSIKKNKKTTPIPQVRTTVENYDNFVTKDKWNANRQNRAKNTENPEKEKVPLSIFTRKTTTASKDISVVMHWETSVVTKPFGIFWNARTTSMPSRKSTTSSWYNSSSKKVNNNWNKASTPSTWQKATKYDGNTTSRKANISNDITSSTRRPTSTQPWNSLIRRTTADPYTSRTNRPSITRQSTYTNGWVWPESEEVKDDWNKKTSRKSTSTVASSVRTISNSRSTSSSIRSGNTNRNSVSSAIPEIYREICGCRNRNDINVLNVRNITDGSRNTGTWNRYQQPFQRIVGGEEAEPFSWPWVAALYKVTSPGGGNRFLSAATLINKYYVLTAAHVFNSDDLRSSSYVVLLGTHNVTVSIAEYTVSTILLHPQYEKRYYYNDIALLRLEQPVQYNDLVMPVCLPTRNSAFLKDSDLEGRRVTVMGWGDDSFGGRSSHVLREATFPIVSRKSCNASYVRVASNRFPRGIIKEMLCAGSPKGGMDACQGDSGGPLLVWESGRYTQVGIVSFGYKCGDKDFPGVYTKVASYIEWIIENTQQRRS